MNQNEIRKWWKVAMKVANQFHASREKEALNGESNQIRDSGKRIEVLLRRFQLASERNWKAAQSLAVNDCRQTIEQSKTLLDETNEALAEAMKDSSVKPKEIFLDLMAMQREFDELRFDAKQQRLSVLSKSIRLEDLELGRFRIELHLKSLSPSSQPYYEVIATEANRPSVNEDVTHPHVQNDRLCEGDAQPAIKMALGQGRLLDFFQLVEQVLGTYNSSSPFVAISEWEGTNCGQCGHNADPADCRDCMNCEANICDDCTYVCSDCSESFCGNCDEPCRGCLESTCGSCIGRCADCDEPFCSVEMAEQKGASAAAQKFEMAVQKGTTWKMLF